ncbi:hypothetical protein D3C86_1294020 [compost metagenome]
MASHQAARDSSWSHSKDSADYPSSWRQRPYPRHRAGLHPGDGGARQSRPPGRIHLERLNAKTVTAVQPLIAPDALLCSDGVEVYASFSDNASGGAQPCGRTGGGGISHPACERVPQAVEVVDGAVP